MLINGFTYALVFIFIVIYVCFVWKWTKKEMERDGKNEKKYKIHRIFDIPQSYYRNVVGCIYSHHSFIGSFTLNNNSHICWTESCHNDASHTYTHTRARYGV